MATSTVLKCSYLCTYMCDCVLVYFIAHTARRSTSIGWDPLPTLDNWMSTFSVGLDQCCQTVPYFDACTMYHPLRTIPLKCTIILAPRSGGWWWCCCTVLMIATTDMSDGHASKKIPNFATGIEYRARKYLWRDARSAVWWIFFQTEGWVTLKAYMRYLHGCM